MCEPSHSIVQYPDDPSVGPLQKILDHGKRILRWFHFSKMGAGHSGANPVSYTQSRFLPGHVDYEAFWWNRQFRIDGFNKEVSHEALECAREYADRVSIGSLPILRRFLEESMKKTFNHGAYVRRFEYDFLNRNGAHTFWAKAKSIFGIKTGNFTHLPEHQIEQFTKFMLGFTRKRDLIVPEWADVDELWLPGK